MQQSLDNAPPHTHTLIHHDNRLRTLTEKYTLASTKEGNHRAFPIGTLTRNEAIHHSHTHTHTYTHTHSHNYITLTHIHISFQKPTVMLRCKSAISEIHF